VLRTRGPFNTRYLMAELPLARVGAANYGAGSILMPTEPMMPTKPMMPYKAHGAPLYCGAAPPR
jgi:hypothetical protein